MTSRESRNPPRAKRRPILVIDGASPADVRDIGHNQQRFIVVPRDETYTVGAMVRIQRSDRGEFTMRVITHVLDNATGRYLSLRPLTEAEKQQL